MKKLILLFLTFFLLSGSMQTHAGCYFSPIVGSPANGLQLFSVPLRTNTISVPAGVSVGEVIYKQKFKINNNSGNIQNIRIECDEAASFYFRFQYGALPYSPSETYSDVYKTNLPGIGVKYMVNETKSYPSTSAPMSTCESQYVCREGSKWYYENEFQLIKIAELVEPGMISGSDFPLIQYLVGHQSSMVNIHEVSFVGSINVTVPTCNISATSKNMSVQLGTFKSSVFTAPGTGTPWQDASIKLDACGQFYGRTDQSMASYNGAVSTNTGSLTPNAWVLTLSPYDGLIDAANGIMKINDIPSQAYGVGIQLSSTQSVTGLIDLNNPVTKNLPDDGTTNVTIPIYARFIQTENVVYPGKANGKLLYTVSYH